MTQAPEAPLGNRALVRWFEDLDNDDVAIVGGKNASLGEMIGALADRGVRVPGGFAVTAAAYRQFVDHNDLAPRIRDGLARFERDPDALSDVGGDLRRAFERGSFPDPLRDAVRDAYAELARRVGQRDPSVAVRSSATAEDLPEASFAGQQESFLAVSGEQDVLDAVRRCFASLFTDRAISYRAQQGMGALDVALSVGVQRMIRSDRAGAGVLFTLDTDTGFPDLVLIDAAWGLGEAVVGGLVDPDHYRVFKPLLEREELEPIVDKRLGGKERRVVYADRGTRVEDTPDADRDRFVLDDREIVQLARWARIIEGHYGRPMDVEWAKDGDTGELFVVQARPETVQSRKGARVETHRLTGEGPRLLEGLAIGTRIGVGEVVVVRDLHHADDFPDGGVLVTEMTDPDWVPLMKRAAAIVTDHGGRTSHAAIVSRELGVPAVVGTGRATHALSDGQIVTVSCAEGDTGAVYEGRLDFEVDEVDLRDLPRTDTRIMMTIADPDAAYRWWRLPADGIGLLRMEFLVEHVVKVHPMALARFDAIRDADVRRRIEEITRGWADKEEFFVARLAQGIARIAASRWPDPVIVRLSDFKTNEYAQLVGGRAFEPVEENPMLGLRGASRYYSDAYRDGFALECLALKRARDDIGLDNLIVMVPFCRTLAEADRVLEEMADHGLEQGENGLEIYMMVEIPSNVILADRFAERFDGFSIGSNDLTQLVLGVDRDAAALADLFDDRDEAVRAMIADAIEAAHQAGIPIGLCGQAPSDHPEFAAFLVECGIDSISVNPDRLVEVRRIVAEAERR